MWTRRTTIQSLWTLSRHERRIPLAFHPDLDLCATLAHVPLQLRPRPVLAVSKPDSAAIDPP